jgi:hypothetical protein
MLPRAEVRILTHLTVLAVDMATEGCVAEGYICLVEGFCRIKSLDAASEPWSQELMGHYRRTLDDYADRYYMARD